MLFISKCNVQHKSKLESTMLFELHGRHIASVIFKHEKADSIDLHIGPAECEIQINLVTPQKQLVFKVNQLTYHKKIINRQRLSPA